MNREQRVAFVEELHELLGQTPHILLTTFRGLEANQANELRNSVRGVGGKYRVVKNRLAKRAAAGTPAEAISERLVGPCALALHDDDPVALAKALTEFAKGNPEVEVLAGVLDARESMDAASVKALAALPGLPELRAQLLALILTPATSLVRLFGTPGTQLARVLDARNELRTEDATASDA